MSEHPFRPESATAPERSMPLAARLAERFPGHQELGTAWQVAIGSIAALIAVAIRIQLPLTSSQLPTLTVVVAITLTATFVGFAAGLTTAMIGGLVSWYLFFTPFSFGMGPDGSIPLLGFLVIAASVLTASGLYRHQARRYQQAQAEAARKDVETAELFARELAHRLKNALAVVQSIAVQTVPDDDGKRSAFTARLQAMAAAHDLLTEHVAQPTAKVTDVAQLALRPFVTDPARLALECDDLTLAGQDVVSLSLVLHELATNASKYGAWSSAGGAVALTIADAGDDMRLTWQESGGPRVKPVTGKGFGSKLLTRVGREPAIDWQPGGLVYATRLPRA
jgi:two-component sensor histidine kinase